MRTVPPQTRFYLVGNEIAIVAFGAKQREPWEIKESNEVNLHWGNMKVIACDFANFREQENRITPGSVSESKHARVNKY